VHRKKDATDWGVEPQIIVPMDDDAQRDIMELHSRQEAIPSPLSRPSTRPVAAATQPADPQLQQAIYTLMGSILQPGQLTAQGPLATQPAGNAK
jgi:hypothetical protein